jgi:hypothetical protein
LSHCPTSAALSAPNASTLPCSIFPLAQSSLGTAVSTHCLSPRLLGFIWPLRLLFIQAQRIGLVQSKVLSSRVRAGEGRFGPICVQEQAWGRTGHEGNGLGWWRRAVGALSKNPPSPPLLTLS